MKNVYGIWFVEEHRWYGMYEIELYKKEDDAKERINTLHAYFPNNTYEAVKIAIL